MKMAFLILFATSFMSVTLPATAEVLKKVEGEDFTVDIRTYPEKDTVIVYDLVYAGHFSRAGFVGRQFLLEMAAMQDRDFSEVVLAYKGEMRIRIHGDGVKRLSRGYRLGEMQAVHTLMKLPSLAFSLEGKRLYRTWSDGGLSVLASRTQDFNDFQSRWYLESLLNEIQ